MKSKRRLLILAGLLFIALMAVLANPYSRQLLFGPRIQGFPLSVWQDDLRRLGQRAKESSFNGTLKRFGINPPRLDWMRLSDSERETICLSLVDDPKPGVRRAIAWGLALKGPHGPWFQENITLTPGATSKDAFAALLRLLDDANEIVRDSAASNINPYHTSATGAAEQIKAFLINDDPQRRILALEVLAKCPIQKDALESYIPVLVKMLDDSDPKVRTAAATQLGSPRLRKRRTAKAAVPKLRDCLLDPDPLCRVETAHALWNLQGDQAAVVSIFREALGNPSKEIRRVAINHLRSMVNVCPELWDELARCATNDEDIGVKYWALQDLGNCDRRAVPVLIAIVAGRELGTTYYRNALEALGNLGSESKEAVPFLLSQLFSDGNGIAKTRIVEPLGEIGPEAREAVPALLALLTNAKDGDLRAAVAVALGKIGADDPGVVATLVALLDTDEYDAIQALSYVGSKAKDAVPAFLRLLQTPGGKPFLVSALGNIGPEARTAVPELLRMLRGSSYPYDAQLIIVALGQIGHDATNVVPALLPYLRNNSAGFAGVPTATAKALARFGPEAQAAIPALTTLLDDDDEELAEAAAMALTAIDPVRYPKR